MACRMIFVFVDWLSFGARPFSLGGNVLSFSTFFFFTLHTWILWCVSLHRTLLCPLLREWANLSRMVSHFYHAVALPCDEFPFNVCALPLSNQCLSPPPINPTPQHMLPSPIYPGVKETIV